MQELKEVVVLMAKQCCSLKLEMRQLRGFLLESHIISSKCLAFTQSKVATKSYIEESKGYTPADAAKRDQEMGPLHIAIFGQLMETAQEQLKGQFKEKHIWKGQL